MPGGCHRNTHNYVPYNDVPKCLHIVAYSHGARHRNHCWMTHSLSCSSSPPPPSSASSSLKFSLLTSRTACHGAVKRAQAHSTWQVKQMPTTLPAHRTWHGPLGSEGGLSHGQTPKPVKLRSLVWPALLRYICPLPLALLPPPPRSRSESLPLLINPVTALAPPHALTPPHPPPPSLSPPCLMFPPQCVAPPSPHSPLPRRLAPSQPLFLPSTLSPPRCVLVEP